MVFFGKIVESCNVIVEFCVPINMYTLNIIVFGCQYIRLSHECILFL